MLSAKEAREKTNRFYDPVIAELHSTIVKASEQGVSRVYVPLISNGIVVDILRDLGYTVLRAENRTETLIIWP